MLVAACTLILLLLNYYFLKENIMNEFYRRVDSAIVTEMDVRNAFVNSGLPTVLDKNTLDSLGYDPILHSPMPEVTHTQQVYRNGVEQDALGNWVEKWSIRDIEPEIIAERLSSEQAIAWEAIKAERDSRERDGGTKVGDKWFHSDPDSKIKQITLMMLGSNIPANLQWKTMDGSFVLMTPALAMQIFQTVSANVPIIYARAELHKQAMLQVAEPLKYDFSTGWPQTFAESRNSN